MIAAIGAAKRAIVAATLNGRVAALRHPEGATAAGYEAFVAARFDALAGRFKREVKADDPRLMGLFAGLRPVAGARVLDLGCGKGRFALALREHGARVVGLDVSRAMIGAATSGGLDRVRGSARRLPFGPASFNGVIAVEVFEHLAPRAFDFALREVRRVLVPGGTFLLIDKNVFSLSARRRWLPSIVAKWVDERRGRWMYCHRDPVKERWFRPGALRRRLLRDFTDVRLFHLLSPPERGRFPFEQFPAARLFVLCAARAPGGLS
jgi:2-polyprenyl-6-hydroxyphenyl methylase/3-demethylubiquinone-9 3-methyltransferase